MVSVLLISPVRILFLLVIASAAAFAQPESTYWYFGANAGVSFKGGVPTALTDGQLLQGEGSAAVADSLGNLLFYTDGINVFNRQHTRMPNGHSMNGAYTSTQSGVIFRKPGSRHLYYVFSVGTWIGGHQPGLYYSIVDMTLDGGLGDVTAEKNMLIDLEIAEQLLLVPHDNPENAWLLVRKRATFYAYTVSPSGINSTPVVSQVGLGLGYDMGYMKVSLDRKRIVAAYYLQNMFELYDFDKKTGVVTNPIAIGPAPEYHGAYGVEFSPDRTKLYTTCTDRHNPDIYQFDLEAGDSAGIAASRTTIHRAVDPFPGALQLGPDWKIYVARTTGAVGSGRYLSAITAPDQPGAACGFVDSALYLAGMSSLYGLPTRYPAAIEELTLVADTVEARAGDRIKIPVTLRAPIRARTLGATYVTATITYDTTVLYFDGGIDGATLLEPGKLELTYTLTSLPDDSTLIASLLDRLVLDLPFTAMLGMDSTVPLKLSDVTVDSPMVEVTPFDGEFRLLDLCYQGGARLYNPSGTVALKPIRPNPAATTATLELTLTEAGTTTILLYDLRGSVVATLADQEMSVGRHTLSLDLDEIPSGSYILVMQTPTVRRSQAFEVVK